MEISILALTIIAFPVCVVSLNYILVSRREGRSYAVGYSYFVLVLAMLSFIGGLIVVVRAFIIGDVTSIGRPGNMLMILAIIFI